MSPYSAFCSTKRGYCCATWKVPSSGMVSYSNLEPNNVPLLVSYLHFWGRMIPTLYEMELDHIS